MLQESLKGKALTQFYANNGYLIDSFRADLIIIILEDILFHDRKLSPKDFPPIIEEILNEFPNELKVSIYYFLLYLTQLLNNFVLKLSGILFYSTWQKEKSWW